MAKQTTNQTKPAKTEPKTQSFKEQFGYTISDLDALRTEFLRSRQRIEGMWRVLDSYDSGEFWDTIRNILPKHQIIPDTNLIYYVKQNQVNSIYAAPYIADITPIDPQDMDKVRQFNKFIEYVYNQKDLGNKQLAISMRTALWNLGCLQIGWDDSAKNEHLQTDVVGGIDIIPRDPMSVLLDPNFDDFQEGRAVFIATEDSLENLEAQYPDADLSKFKPDTKDKSKVNLQMTNTASPTDTGQNVTTRFVDRDTQGMLPVWIAYKKVPLEKGGFRIDQIIYTQDETILYKEKGIQPNYYPIVILYNSPPQKGPYGISICQRVLKNVLSLNILDSVAVTHTYAAQRTPWVFDTNSGLSIRRVQRDINRPDKILPIQQGSAKDALARLEYPALPDNLQMIRDSLVYSIKDISGIDDKYTGRDTASVTTTGGMERLQQRATLPDNSKISMIEMYAKNLTRMIMDFHTIKGGQYKFVASREEDEVELLSVDFGKVKSGEYKFLYTVNASPLLPKTRARLAEAANIIMQTQLQFAQAGQQVQLLTPEEWLYFQDFPQKDMILDRMKLDRLRNDKEEIASELTSFSAMTEQGMRPESAVEQLANERAERRKPSVRKNMLQNMGQ